MQLILGSQSSRRKEILGFFSYPFIQVSPPFDEDSVLFTGDPVEYVSAISKGKASSLAVTYPDAVILAADTIVFHAGRVYNKPKDVEEAFQTLSQLSGGWHAVYTAVTVQSGAKIRVEVDLSKVLFNALSAEQIRAYLANNPWHDKAGGYAIQKRGGLLVCKIDGCYYNVMGLPIHTLQKLLKEFGIDLWQHQ